MFPASMGVAEALEAGPRPFFFSQWMGVERFGPTLDQFHAQAAESCLMAIQSAPLEQARKKT